MADQQIKTQTLIIGAGPGGLYSAFSLGLLGISCHIVDVLPQPGGQCVQLYADKTIYDIPAISQCDANGLVERLLEQVQPFDPAFHFNQLVSELRVTTDRNQRRVFEVKTDKDLCIQSQAVLIASGSGAFLPRKLKLEGLEAFVDQQVFYFPPDNIKTLAGQHVVINGDLEQSLQFANQLATMQQGHSEYPASVTLVHRRDKFRAEDHTINQTQILRETGALQFLAGSLNGLVKNNQDQLTELEIKMSADNSTSQIPADALFVLNGTSPSSGFMENWGLEQQHKQLVVNPATFQTSEAGVFAVGDVVSYPGKRKLIVSAFHEAALAAYSIASYLNGGEPVPLQYTSSNTALQARLKV